MNDQVINFPIERKVNLAPEIILLIQNADTIVAEFGKVVIDTQEQYAKTADQLQKVKGLAAEIESIRAEKKKPFDDAAKEVQSFFKPKLDRLATVESLIKSGMQTYANEQERKAREAAARAEEEARKEREKMQAKAVKLAAAGKDEQAQAMAENAATVVAAPVHVPEAAKVSGISTSKTYSAEVTDFMALVKAVAAGTVPIIAIEANTKFLNQQAKSLKEHLVIPGVKLVENSSIRATAKSPFANQ